MRVLLTADQIARRVTELAEELRREFDPTMPVTALVVLRGAAVFAADLLRAMVGDVRVEFVHAESYRGTSGGNVTVSSLPNLVGAQVLIVEDIIERGDTLCRVVDEARAAGAGKVVAVALLRKPGQVIREVPCQLVTGFDVGPDFVVGYGMDLDGLYRNLPDVWSLSA